MVGSSTVSPTNSLKNFENRIQYISYARSHGYANAFYSVAPSHAVVFHSTGAFNYNELYFITFSMATKLRENLQLLFDDNKE